MAPDLSLHFHTGASTCPPNTCTRKCTKHLFPSEKRPLVFPVEDPEPSTIPAPNTSQLAALTASEANHISSPQTTAVLRYLLTGLTQDPYLPVCLQLRPPHFIQSDREDTSVESHHSSAQNPLKLSRHCPREPTSLTETRGPPHPCSPSAVPQPLSTGFGTSS